MFIIIIISVCVCVGVDNKNLIRVYLGKLVGRVGQQERRLSTCAISNHHNFSSIFFGFFVVT